MTLDSRWHDEITRLHGELALLCARIDRMHGHVLLLAGRVVETQRRAAAVHDAAAARREALAAGHARPGPRATTPVEAAHPPAPRRAALRLRDAPHPNGWESRPGECRRPGPGRG
jgi:hypothetical protein